MRHNAISLICTLKRKHPEYLVEPFNRQDIRMYYRSDNGPFHIYLIRQPSRPGMPAHYHVYLIAHPAFSYCPFPPTRIMVDTGFEDRISELAKRALADHQDAALYSPTPQQA